MRETSSTSPPHGGQPTLHGPRLQGAEPGSPRVALFCTNFLPTSQVFVYEQLRQYARYQADVFAWRRFNESRFPFPRVHLAEPLYVVRGRSRRFDRAFAQRDFDVVHAHFGPAGAYARGFAQSRRLPLVVTFHGYDVPLLASLRRLWPVHWPYALGARRLLQSLRLGICASSELRELLLDLDVPAERLVVHRLGVDLDRFAFSARRSEPLVAMVGRLVEKKGFEFGLSAFRYALRSSEASSNLRMVVVGTGPRGRSLRALAGRLGIADRVAFVGGQSNEQVAGWLSRARALLAPSVVARDGNRESGLIVVKEASAVGTVPIATRHGGIPDSIEHGETGFLVPERDAAAMGDCLRRLSGDEGMRRRLAAAGRSKMEREFDNRSLVAGLEALYDQARGVA